MSDNQWAAEYLGLRTEGTLHCKDEYWTSDGGNNNFVCDTHEWRPDADLNQFKLVLGKYTQEYDESSNAINPSDISGLAFSDTSAALKAMREAVDGARSLPDA